MGAPRYIPRDFSDQPKAFGKSPHLQFSPLELDESDGPLTEAERRRRRDRVAFARNAKEHHEYALAINHIRQIQGLTQAAYGALVGDTAKRAGEVLRGVALMRPDDIERADQALGSVHIVVEVNRRRRKVQEIQAAIEEIQRGSQNW